jgi:predicted ATPase
LADCFVYSWNEQKKDFLIIETHSEHFVLRLLRRVRESFSDELLHTSLTLLPKDLGLIYFRPVGDKTSIYEIRVSDDGQFLDAWPEGFFDDRDEDIWGPLN